MFDLILTFVVVFLSYLFWRDNSRKKYPPGPIKFPFLGNIPQIAASGETLPYKLFHKYSKKYGDIMSFKIGVNEMVVLTSMEDFNDLLVKDEGSDRAPMELVYERNQSRNMEFGVAMNGGGHSWKTLRTFSIQNLRKFGWGRKHSMESVLTEEANSLISRTLHKSQENSGIVLLNDTFFSLYLLNGLWSMIAGQRFSDDDPRLLHLLELNCKVFKSSTFGGDISIAFPLIREYFPSLTNKSFILDIYSQFRGFCREIINEHRAREEYKTDPQSFVDILLNKIDEQKFLEPEEERIFTEKQFEILIGEFFQVGTETVNSALSYAILFMVLNPEVQKKVHKEIDQVCEMRDVRLEDRQNMIYTQAVIHEILRCGVVVPLTPPRAISKDCEYKGYFFKKGTVLFLNYYSATRNEKFWKSPQNFDPSRFLSSDGKKLINLEKVAPFGYGKRICLGETLASTSIFLYFSLFMQHFELSPVEGEPLPSSEPQPSFTATPQQFKMRVTKRTNKL